MRFKNIKSILGVTLLSIYFLGCASEQEKNERRENAFNLEGSYKTTGEKSELQMVFSIVNESGRHDISIHLDRDNTLTEKENQLLQKHNINTESVKGHFGRSLILGKGFDESQITSGGENISKDFGQTSEFNVCTENYNYSKTYTLIYCLEAQVSKDTGLMSGNLVLKIKNIQTKSDGSQQYSINMIKLGFETNARLIFHKQYLGQWNGDLYLVEQGIPSSHFTDIFIEEKENFFVAQLKQTQISVYNETYVYDINNSRTKTEKIKNMDFPSMQITYRSTKSNKRLVIFGQLWSLGDLSGSIILIDDQNQTELGTFKFRNISF